MLQFRMADLSPGLADLLADIRIEAEEDGAAEYTEPMECFLLLGFFMKI